jgi:diguanylate cyclase (GGDEF)-like protein
VVIRSPRPDWRLRILQIGGEIADDLPMFASPVPMRSRARLAFAVGGILTLLAAIVPSWVASQRNASALTGEASAFARVFTGEVTAQLREFDTLAPRWAASEPLLSFAANNDPLGPTASQPPKLLFPGFVAFEPPFVVGPGETPPTMLAAYVQRIDKGYAIINNFVSMDLAATQMKLGLNPIPNANDNVKFINLSLTAIQRAQMIPAFTDAGSSDVGKSLDTWALAYPVTNRGWLVAPIATEGFSKLLATSRRSEALDVAIHAGANETAPLIARRAMKQGSSSLRRTVSTTRQVGQPFTFVIAADAHFATSSVPSPMLTVVVGVMASTLMALLLGRRHQKQNERVLTNERDAANKLARTDALTQLPNRLAITESLDELSRRTLRDHPIALLLCDLDRFKIVNDARGHDAGDTLLIEVARRLQRIAPEAMVARLGGDEFIVLLEKTSSAQAVDVAHQIVERLREPFAVGVDRVVIGVSVGLTVVEADEPVDRPNVLRDADLAMYGAKREGGNCVHVVTEELRRSGGGQLDLELELRAAFGTGQLVAWYQPLVDCNEEIHALEALVRWQHPTKGLLNPGSFLPAAKRAGLLAELSTDVLSQVCREVSEWNRQRIERSERPVIVHVNCVEEQLMDLSFADVVGTYLSATGMNPAHLLLEISEETAMDRLPKGIPTVQAIRAMGVKFSLDDFGFGNASLTMVRQLGGVAEIKLDKSIVDGLAGVAGPDAADLAVIKAVRKFATDQHIVLVAEGIEQPEQRDLLITLGIDLMQGYLFHKPQPADRIADLLLSPKHERQLTL